MTKGCTEFLVRFFGAPLCHRLQPKGTNGEPPGCQKGCQRVPSGTNGCHTAPKGDQHVANRCPTNDQRVHRISGAFSVHLYVADWSPREPKGCQVGTKKNTYLFIAVRYEAKMLDGSLANKNPKTTKSEIMRNHTNKHGHDTSGVVENIMFWRFRLGPTLFAIL